MKNNVRSNYLYLTILQIINYVLPLIIIPFLIVKLGTEGFGVISFALATITFFRVVTSYGFDLTASREISINRESKEKLVNIFSVVMTARVILGFMCFLFLLLIVYIVPSVKNEYLIFLLTYLIVIGDILFPVWFFQGVEEMKYITIFRVLYKLLYSILVLLFVNEPSDIYLVPLFDGLGSIVTGLISLVYIKVKFDISITIPNLRDVLKAYKDGYDVFLSKVMVVFYSSFNTFILGVFTSTLIVGYYSVAERIYFSVRGLLNPFIQAIFPYFSRLYVKNVDEYRKIEMKITIKLFLVLMILSVIMFVSSDYLYLILNDEVSQTTVVCLKIFSVATLLAMGGYFSTLLVTEGKGSRLKLITTKTVILNMMLIFPFAYTYGAIGATVCFFLVQAYHLILQLKERYGSNEESI
ncbi:TPA: oligosaccharide flippase family protein [Vibrio alginolyticus]